MLDYIEENKLSRLALVGVNSQGKSFLIANAVKKLGKKVIFITNEVKADENIKTSSDTSTLISWLNMLLDNKKIKEEINKEISKIDLTSISENSFLQINLKDNLESYKGIIGVDIKTSSNKWNTPGSGEKFLGQLLLISKILEENNDKIYDYLIVDEPEQHLHPSLFLKVGNILNKISKTGVKVVIATHSPLIVQYFVDDTQEIARVTNGEIKYMPKTEEFIKQTTGLKCYENDQLLLSDYIKIKDTYEEYFINFVLPLIYKSLFSEYILIGEGAIERKIFDIYLLEYGRSMEKNNIDYVISDGKPFIPILMKCMEIIGVKILCIYDVDCKSDPKHKVLNEYIKKFNPGSISFDDKIETYLAIDKSKDKYRGEIIEINSYYIGKNQILLNLLKEIDEKLKSL